MLTVKDLAKQYGDVAALGGISFHISPGETTGIFGLEGAGKTTLLDILSGYLLNYTGNAECDGVDLRRQPMAYRAKIAYIPQSCVPSFNYTLLEVVMMGLTNQIGVFDAPRPEHKTAALEAMESLGIAHLAHRESGRVSGGERQLALLARAMVQNAFEVMNVEVVAISHFVGNEPSRKVIERAGFIFEGVMPCGFKRFDGEIFDNVCYSILRSEYDTGLISSVRRMR